MKLRRKLLAFVLSFALLGTLVFPSPVTVSADEVTTLASGTDGGITWVLDSEYTLTISAAGDATAEGYTSGVMNTYKSGTSDTTARAPWCASDYANSILKIVVEDGVTELGAYAFCGYYGTSASGAVYQCLNVTEVSLPSSLMTIGTYAFAYCQSLPSVTIPSGVITLDQRAFCYCTALTSVTLSSTVTTLGSYLFQGSTSLTSITIPDTVTSLGNNLFNGCTALESVTLPNNESVTTIGNATFSGCTALEEITIPSNITTVERNAFNGCTALTSVTIPDSVTTIGTGLFTGCTSLTYVSIPATITTLGATVFSGCTNTSLKIYLYGTITSITTTTFGSSETTWTAGTVYVADEASYEVLTGENNRAYIGYYDTYGGSLQVKYDDLTELKAVIQTANALVESDYTSETWDVLATALSDAEAYIADTGSYSTYTEESIAEKTNALTQAIEALAVLDNSDSVSALEELSEKIEALLTVKDEGNYTEDSWTALKSALAAAQEALAAEEEASGSTPASVLTALSDALEDAYDGLAVDSSSLDETELLATYTTDTVIYGGDDSGEYSGMEWSTFLTSDDVDMDAVAGTTEVVITFDSTDYSGYQYSLPYGTLCVTNNDSESDMAKYGKYVSEDSTLGYPTNTLTYTLSLSGTDTFALSAAFTGFGEDVALAKVTSVAFYKTSSSGVLANYALDSTIYGGDDGEEYDGWNWTTFLTSDDVDMDAVAGTSYVVITFDSTDYTAYQYSLSYGTLCITNNDSEDNMAQYGQYVSGGTALEYPTNALTYTLSLSGTDTFALSAAFTGFGEDVALAKVTGVTFYRDINADDLAEAIAKSETLVERDYTASTWKALQLCIAEAQALCEDEEATADEYTVKIKEVKRAIAALVAADNTDAYEALQTLITKAKALDESSYTTDSYATMLEALSAASALTEDDLTSTLEAAAETLQAAMNALKETSENPDGTTDKNNTDNTDSGNNSTTSVTVAKGTTFITGNFKYKVTTADKKVAVVGLKASAKKKTALTIPAVVKKDGKSLKVTAINTNAFKGASKLKKVTIGKNVTTIKAKAFNGCKKLASVKTKGKLKTVKKKAFKGVKKKLKVTGKKAKANKKLIKKSGAKVK